MADRKKDILPVLAEFKRHYLNMVNSDYLSPDESDWTREDRFRVSSFPYCGLKHAHKRMNAEDEVEEETVTFGMKYYTSVGTQTHRYIQYVLGHGAKMLGRWKCLTPNCTGVGDKIGFKNICPKCKRPMDYEELDVKAFNHLSGHIDGVWKASDGRYYIIDYKTSSTRVISENKTTGFLPFKKNVAQITAYCALLERELDIEISGWILLYVARDNPMLTVLPCGEMIDKRQKKKLLRKIKRWDRHYGIVMSARKFKDLQVLIDEKPCKTWDQYKESAYHSAFGGCPLGISGACFKPKMLERVIRDDWDCKPKDWLERRRPKYLTSNDR